MVVPHGEDSYYAMRPSINIPRNSLFDLDGFFGLHPSLSALQPLWEQHQLAIVHAVGSPHPTRSHFDAQDFMESGMPGVKATEDGWLNRALRFSHPHAQELAFRAIALGPSLREASPAASQPLPSTTRIASAQAIAIWMLSRIRGQPTVCRTEPCRK